MRLLCVIGGRHADRAAAAASRARGRIATAPVPPVLWPFVRTVFPGAPVSTEPFTILVPDLHLAFPAGQTAGTRLVLTQSTYQLQRWLDWLAATPQATLVAHASQTALMRRAPEAAARRGPWHAIELVEIDGDDENGKSAAADSTGDLTEVAAAFAHGTPGERREAAERAVSRDGSNAALHLAVASACMELDDLQPAQKAVERALALAPDWEAAEFEYGKLWLRADDLERAAERFAAAARLMPTFAAALSNLGATLGETERPEEAVVALEQALRYDPNGYTILNNLSVLHREQGRLDEAAAAARRVTTLAPQFVFGSYNLAHALFLQGRFADARDVYEDAHRRDPQKNPVQGCRLGVARAAAGDYSGAIDALRASAAALPAASRDEVLAESEEILQAVQALPGASAGELQRVLDAVRQERGTRP